MAAITVDFARCKGDGLCARICPARIFAMAERGTPPAVANQELCVKCGQCIAICPNGAVRHAELDAARFVRLDDAAAVDADTFVACLRARRSVRAYKDQPVPRDLIERIVDVAGFSPGSAHGGEGWTRSVTVVAGEDAMRRVRDLTAAYMRALERMLGSPMVPVFARFKEEMQGGLAMLPDMRMRLAETDAGRDAITYGAPAALFVHAPRSTPEAEAHCHAPMMAILLAAHAHGLGTCWNGYMAKAASSFRVKSFRELREWLQIPDHHDCHAAATIGWPLYRLHSLPHRETRVRFVE